MFCPRCGERLNLQNGRYRCVRGRMNLPLGWGTVPGTPSPTEWGRAGEGAAPDEPFFCSRCATALDGLTCPRGCGSLDAALASELAALSHTYGC